MFFPLGYAFSSAVIGLAPVGFWKLDETSGTTAVDSSGNGRNGSVTNATVNQSSLLNSGEGRSYLFVSGSTSRVSVTNNAAFQPGAGSYTVLLFRSKVSNASNLQRAFHTGVGDTVYTGMAMYGGDSVMYCAVADGTSKVTSDAITTSLSSCFIGMVVNRSNDMLETYLNGELYNSKSISGIGSIGATHGPSFGYDPSAGNYFDGNISHVAVFNSALSAANFAELYQASVKKLDVIRPLVQPGMSFSLPGRYLA